MFKRTISALCAAWLCLTAAPCSVMAAAAENTIFDYIELLPDSIQFYAPIDIVSVMTRDAFHDYYGSDGSYHFVPEDADGEYFIVTQYYHTAEDEPVPQRAWQDSDCTVRCFRIQAYEENGNVYFECSNVLETELPPADTEHPEETLQQREIIYETVSDYLDSYFEYTNPFEVFGMFPPRLFIHAPSAGGAVSVTQKIPGKQDSFTELLPAAESRLTGMQRYEITAPQANTVSFSETVTQHMEIYRSEPHAVTVFDVDARNGELVPSSLQSSTYRYEDAEDLQSWLTAKSDDTLHDDDDLNGDGMLDARDLTLMKQMLLEHAAPLMEPPIRETHPSMPSIGKVRIPVIAVNFSDCPFEDAAAEQLPADCFGAADPDAEGYPLESAAAYYERASYRRLRLTGDVIRYTAAHPIDWYADNNAQALNAELLSALDDAVDWQAYDADGNAQLDAMVIVLPEATLSIDRDDNGKPDWWPFSVDSSCKETFDGVSAGTYCVIAHNSSERRDFVRQTAHELAHAMGLPDYYKYDALPGDTEGLPGEAGNELMDEGTGDLSMCSKLLLGWLQPNELQIYRGGKRSFRLFSAQEQPSCIIIPRDTDEFNFLSEYFVIEYTTREGNNPSFTNNGIRVLHVQAEVSKNELSYSNHSRLYDKSNKKQRVLRLVNYSGLFYPDRNGVQIDSDTKGFHWYDDGGELTVAPGVKIRIGMLNPGPYFDEANYDVFSSQDITTDPKYWKGSSYTLTISPDI